MSTDTLPTDDVREERMVRDAYGVALVLVMLAILTLIASDPDVGSALTAVAGLLQVAALVVTLLVSGVGSGRSLVFSVLAIGLFIASGIAIGAGLPAARSAGLAFWLLVTIVTIVMIVRRLATYRRVTVQLVMGLLTIYLLIGVSFGLAYMLADALGPPAFAQDQSGLSDAVYFSFVTLATLGYGDISPGSNVVRALSVAEAIIGQLYLVSVVSLAVGRLGVLKDRTR